MWESWRQEQDKDKQQYQQEKGGQREGEREFRGAPYARAGLEKRVQERRERKRTEKERKKITKLQ